MPPSCSRAGDQSVQQSIPGPFSGVVAGHGNRLGALVKSSDFRRPHDTILLSSSSISQVSAEIPTSSPSRKFGVQQSTKARKHVGVALFLPTILPTHIAIAPLVRASRRGTEAPSRHPQRRRMNPPDPRASPWPNFAMWFTPRRIVRRATWVAIVICSLIFTVFQRELSQEWAAQTLEKLLGPQRIPTTSRDRQMWLLDMREKNSCVGPRGALLSESPDDAIQEVSLANISYPKPFIGSHIDLGLAKTWMTADGRYGPYGYGENKPGYTRSKVDWDSVNWGFLQNDCLERNRHRFPKHARGFDTVNRRFALRESSRFPQWRAWFRGLKPTRRTALVVRAYDGYEYDDEVMWHLRSLIVEAGLKGGGSYTVVLLVHIRDASWNIFSNAANYTAAFQAAKIPKELQSIAVLWDDNLLKSWYPNVNEHRTMWQVNQPLQLFAHHYNNFDHYWQLELDQRFLGDAGVYLDALSSFARSEPRKQALERATFIYTPSSYHQHVHAHTYPYHGFQVAVDHANRGGSHIWGPVRVPEVQPVGPVPPTARPEDDNFQWGVREDADVLVSGFCADVTASNTWVFRDWINGFPVVDSPEVLEKAPKDEDGEPIRQWRAVPRWFCPPAIQRASRTLLAYVHKAQIVDALSIPSEATLPTFALWHGLKLSYPPQPVYLRDELNETETKKWEWFGPEHAKNGWGRGDPQWNVAGKWGDENIPRADCTWWWAGTWPRWLMDVWLGLKDPDVDKEEILIAQSNGTESLVPQKGPWPYLLARVGGEVYFPNVALHPVKQREKPKQRKVQTS